MPNLQVDASAYDAIALDLSNTWSLDSIPPLQPPGFVTFLGIVFAICGHSWIAGRLALWGCLVIATGVSALVAKRVYQRESAAWIAALLCASSPALVAYAGTLQYELLVAVLLLGLLCAAVRIGDAQWEAPTSHLAAAASIGIGTGLAILTREVLVVLVPIVAFYLYLRLSSIGRRRWAVLISVVFVGCASMPPAAWSLRQSARTNRTVAISDKGPLVMAFGNNPAANGTFNAPLVSVREPSGWSFIKANPGAAARLWIRKAGYFWGILRDGWNVPRPSGAFVANATAGLLPLTWILPWARGGWLLVVFLLALASWRRETWTVWWLIPAVVAGVMAVHVVSISSYRFAVPTLPLVMAVAAGPLARALTALWRSRSARIAAAVVVLLAIGAQGMSWRLVYALDPTELDGVSAENRFDAETGQPSRFADASRGRRMVLALVDEYLPAGALTIHMSVRTDGASADPSQALFRVALSTIEGSTVCDHVVTGADVSRQQTMVDVRCQLAKSGPSTLLIETLGAVDLVFGPLRIVRSKPLRPLPSASLPGLRRSSEPRILSCRQSKPSAWESV